MFKRHVAIATAAALVFAAPAWASAAGDLASGMQNLVGQTFEGGIKISAIAADGETLVITIDGPASWRDGLSDDQISDALFSGFCSSAPAFFDSGLAARVDSLDHGQDLHKGPIVSSCPKQAAGS